MTWTCFLASLAVAFPEMLEMNSMHNHKLFLLDTIVGTRMSRAIKAQKCHNPAAAIGSEENSDG